MYTCNISINIPLLLTLFLRGSINCQSDWIRKHTGRAFFRDVGKKLLELISSKIFKFFPRFFFFSNSNPVLNRVFIQNGSSIFQRRGKKLDRTKFLNIQVFSKFFFFLFFFTIEKFWFVFSFPKISCQIPEISRILLSEYSSSLFARNSFTIVSRKIRKL